MLHVDAVGEEPELSEAYRVVVEVGASDLHRVNVLIFFVQPQSSLRNEFQQLITDF